MHTLTACLPSGQTTLTHSAHGQLLEIGSGQHDLVKLPAHHLTPPYVDPTENQNVTWLQRVKCLNKRPTEIIGSSPSYCAWTELAYEIGTKSKN